MTDFPFYIMMINKLLDRLAVPHDAGDRVNARFQLHAPGKRRVAVMGDWNGWAQDTDALVPDGDGWWQLDRLLTPGRYTYQFVVDDELVICDPYARSIERQGEGEPPRAIAEIGQPAHQWQNDAWKRPLWNDLVIYEMNVADFSPEGTFRGAEERLEHLQELGVNAIELMPVYEPASETGWGYNPAYFFAPRRPFGTANDLKAFVDAAHARGLAVILDMVLAHTAHRHPFTRLYPYHESPWYGPGCGKENEFGFPMLDYTKPATQAFARDILAYWLLEFHVDGYRFDYCPGIGRCDPHGLPMLVRMAHDVRKDVYLIAEYLPEDPIVLQGCGMDAAWHSRGTSGITALLAEHDYRNARWDEFELAVRFLDPAREGYEAASLMVNYIESHDEERTSLWLEGAGFNPEHIMQKLRLGAVALATMPGEPMVYQGQEWGQATWRQVNAPNPLHWEQLKTEQGQALFKHYPRLFALRRLYPALAGEGVALRAVYRNKKVVAYERWSAGADRIIVVLNFSRLSQSFHVPFPAPGVWSDLLTGNEIDAAGETGLTLAPYTAALFCRTKRSRRGSTQ